MTTSRSDEQRVIVVCGGGVAGSTAAATAARCGAFVIVLEQGRRPYGKVDVLMPRWCADQADDERADIDVALAHPNILFVPATRLGSDVAAHELFSLGIDLLVLAHGAERERVLADVPIEGLGDGPPAGFVNQRDVLGDRALWVPGSESGHRQDGALVVGGGLGAVDCAKTLVFGVVARALAARNITMPYDALEAVGVPAALARHRLDAAALGITGVRILARRDLAHLRLSPPGVPLDLEATHAFVADLAARYLVKVVPDVVPVAAITDSAHGSARIVGLACERTRTTPDGRLERVPDSRFELATPVVVSAIGWQPRLVPGIPSAGDFYRVLDPETGVVAGISRTIVVGTAASGRGGFEDTRAQARQRVERALGERFGLGALGADVAVDATSEVEALLARPPLASGRVEALLRWARARQRAVGFSDYRDWIHASPR